MMKHKHELLQAIFKLKESFKSGLEAIEIFDKILKGESSLDAKIDLEGKPENNKMLGMLDEKPIEELPEDGKIKLDDDVEVEKAEDNPNFKVTRDVVDKDEAFSDTMDKISDGIVESGDEKETML